MKRMIPYSTQTISPRDINAVVQVLKSPLITQGPRIEQFEKRLAAYVGTRFAVAFSSGTAALHGAYFAASLKAGDELITSPLTFAATANAALYCGGKPLFADIDENTGNIDPQNVLKKITAQTKIIVGVDYAGVPAPLHELKKIAQKHKLIFIEDAAHALGATYNEKKIGSIADMTMFSFHPVKTITTGEGGAITTNNNTFYERLRLFRNHGITKDPKLLAKKSQPAWYYEMQSIGVNYRMTDIHAALGFSQMQRINSFIRQRTKRASLYTQALASLQSLILPTVPAKITSAWHLYVVRLAKKYADRRDEIFKHLHNAGIGVQVHYIPVYLHPYYTSLGYQPGLCPNAEQFFKRAISLPLYPTLTAKNQMYIINVLKKLLV